MKKRLLSIDGGGIRGIIAAKVLQRIEEIACKSDPQYTCLADYFDFIGGTSTGSIIAAGLSKGMKVKDILHLYVNDGKEIFQAYWPIDIRRFKAEYNPQNLQNILKNTFGDITLGSGELKTLLMITTNNIGAGSTWFFTNSKTGKFYEQNKNIYIRDLLRASSAAPSYFPPHSFEISGKQTYFIDGGVSSYNNPSLQLFLEATQEKYGIGWEMGSDSLQVISVGTGFSRSVIAPPNRVNGPFFTQASWIGYVIDSLMEDANLEQNHLMKVLSANDMNEDELRALEKPENYPLNLLKRSLGQEFQSQFDYHRYTVQLDKSRLQGLLNKSLSDEVIAEIRKMDCVNQIPLLVKIGEAVANEQVQPSDFADSSLTA